MEAVLGWFANPIFGDGDYPVSLKIKHGALLPTFSPEEKLWVKTTADFFALSFGPNNLRLGRDMVQYGQTVTPDLRRVLGWIKHEYGDPRVLVAEGGWFSEASVGKEDTVAIYLMKRFINQVLQGKRRIWKSNQMKCRQCNEVSRKKKPFHLFLLCFLSQLSGLMVCRYLATLPGHWWMDLSGIMASLLGEAFSTLTSATQTEPGPPRPPLSTTGMLLLTMVSLEMKPPERWKTVSPVNFTGVLLTPLYR